MIRRTGVLLAAILAFSAANVKATLIDSFDAKSQSYSVSRYDRHDSGQVKPGLGEAIGGYRDVGIQWISGNRSDVEVFTDHDEPGLSFSQNCGQAIAKVTWDGARSPNHLSFSLDADLTLDRADDFLFDIAEVTGNGMGLTMMVYTNANRVSEFTSVVKAGTSGALKIPYSSFTPVGCRGAADFSNVGAIVLELDGMGHTGSDITIDSIRTSSPEPSTLVLAAIGATAFLGLRRRWRRV